MMTSLRDVRYLVAVVAVAVVSACAVIPSSGPVTRVADDAGLGQSAVRYTPARPLPGASPEQIVRGYLDAMLAFPVSSRTASAFLTPSAAQVWSASAQVRIYSGPEVSQVEEAGNRGELRNQPGGPVSVRLGFTENAQLDRQGRYARRATPAALTYSLEQVDGEWRITNPQSGILIDGKFFADYFRPFTLFFFDRPGRRLVPETVHLVSGDQLATTLISSLSGGPDPDAVEATRTYLPPRKNLRPSVPISEEGVADVEFTQDFRDLSSSARDHLSAQIVWTLRQVPGVEGVQIVGGSTALAAGGDEVQPIQAWGGYGPSTARGRAYAVIDDAVVEIDDGDPTPVSGSWGEDARGVRSVAVSEAGVAGVDQGGDQVRLTSRSGDDARVVGGNGFIGPDWDSDGVLWLLDRASGRTRVRVVDGDEPRSIDPGGLAGLQVSAFELSPDGSRYVATGTGARAGRLYVGRVLRDVKDRVLGLGDPQQVFTTAQSPRSASWSSATELAFLADSQAGVQVYRAAIDGSSTTSEVTRSGALVPDVGAQTLAIGPGESPVLYVTDEQDRLWFLGPEGSWRLIEGPPVTGLTFGR
ncbi:MAG: LpqB family beta-propeller domain-containing protein [Aeromicrobium sp.]